MLFQQSVSITPKDFILLCFPSYSRVYIEVAFGHDPSLDRLPWDDAQVRNAYYLLSGFDPSKMQFADFSQQHDSLNSAREVDLALFNADEHAELDGRAALDYASGWMACYDWFKHADRNANPTDKDVDAFCLKASAGYQFQTEFELGFKTRAKLGTKFTA